MVSTDPSGLEPLPEGSLHQDILYHYCSGNTGDAAALFIEAKERLLDVDSWHKRAGCSQVCFRLYDTAGHPQQRPARHGDLVLTEHNEPGPRDDGSLVWMRISAIIYDDYPDEQREAIRMELMPATDPRYADVVSDAMLQGLTASCLIIERKGSILESSYHAHSGHVHRNAPGSPISGREASDPPYPDHNSRERHWASLVSGLIDFDL